MELITKDGEVAPRLGDVTMSEEEAIVNFAIIMQDVVRMLCVGTVHGDLSEFNVLLDDYSPVIIDLPQAVNAAANNNAKSMLMRDVQNMVTYFGQFDPYLHETKFGQEIWHLFEEGKLRPDTVLTGEFIEDTKKADVGAVKRQIKEAYLEEQRRLERLRENKL